MTDRSDRAGDWQKDISLIRTALDRAAMATGTHFPSQVTQALYRIEQALASPPSGNAGERESEHAVECWRCGETLHDNKFCDDPRCPIGGRTYAGAAHPSEQEVREFCDRSSANASADAKFLADTAASANAGKGAVVAWRFRFADGGCTAWFDGKPPNHHGPYELAYVAPLPPAPDALREAIIAMLERRQRLLAANAHDPKFNDTQQEIWASLANEKLDDIRAIRALSTPLPSGEHHNRAAVASQEGNTHD